MQAVLLTISEESHVPSASRRMALISGWVFKFSLACPPQANGKPAVTQETAPMLAALWDEALSDVPTDALGPAFRATLQGCKWFPTVADIRSHINSAEDSRGEDEWQNLLEYIRRYYHPDLGLRAPRQLPGDIDHACRAAGGVRYLESCSEDNLQWAKKRFLEDLARQRKSGEIAFKLPPSPLTELLAKFTPKLSLPAATQALPPAGSPEQAAERITNAPPQPSYSLHKKREIDPVFAEAVRHAAARWQQSNERIFVEYRKAHGIPTKKIEST